MTNEQSTVHGRREFLAAVALTELPVPQRISFRSGAEADRADVTVVLDSIAVCRTWAQALGVDLGSTWCDGPEEIACGYGLFANQAVCLIGRDPAPAPELALTGATRDRLQALTSEVD